MFYGENPPQAALISYFTKDKPASVALKIADAAGREVREITDPGLVAAGRASTRRAGTCACSRSPAPDLGAAAAAPQDDAQGGRGGGQGADPPVETVRVRLRRWRRRIRRRRRRWLRRRRRRHPGPFVLPGSYTVSLVVDGKSIETKPLRVVGDPEVVLTEAQRKQLFDMAMEMHELQKRTTEAAGGVASLNRQLTQLSTDVGARTDVPADVKSQLDSLNRRDGDGGEAAGRRRRRRARGGGGGGRGGDTTIVGKIGQAKNGLSGGMWPTSITMKAYSDAEDRRAEGAVRRQRAVRQGRGGEHVAGEVQPHARPRRSR